MELRQLADTDGSSLGGLSTDPSLIRFGRIVDNIVGIQGRLNSPRVPVEKKERLRAVLRSVEAAGHRLISQMDFDRR